MSDTLVEKIDHLERLIVELNTKIDNFLGYEDLSDKEKKEIEEIRREIKRGDYIMLDELFGE